MIRRRNRDKTHNKHQASLAMKTLSMWASILMKTQSTLIQVLINQNIFANLDTNDGILDHGGLDIENVIRTKHSIPSSMKSEDNTCKLCGKTFTRAWNLKAHIQSVHEGVKKKYVGKFVGRHEETLHTSGIPSKNVINSASIASMLFPVKRE